MIQEDFAAHVVEIIKNDADVVGLAVAGSWISKELDEYSDLDLVLVTTDKKGGDKLKMLEQAKRFGDFISGFTGEHVGEPRVLICLYDNPLLHVDIKFLTLGEFYDRVENPVVLFERDGQLTEVLSKSKASWPQPDFQWIEDRFWTWVHYIAAKAARGEYFECLDGLGFIRAVVLTPLLQVKSKTIPRGMRKVETKLSSPDLENLKITVAQYSGASIFKALENSISIYRSLRKKLFTEKQVLQTLAEKRSIEYLKQVKQKTITNQ
ncbi:MAG: nucleotidyltransferase domain-containing protein [Chitinophagaceae bacterium]